jgi:hypothetical protein
VHWDRRPHHQWGSSFEPGKLSSAGSHHALVLMVWRVARRCMMAAATTGELWCPAVKWGARTTAWGLRGPVLWLGGSGGTTDRDGDGEPLRRQWQVQIL